MSIVTFAKHQVGALVATAVDFSVMVAVVELFGRSAVLATAIGAACGAITNFTLGRHWIFARRAAADAGGAPLKSSRPVGAQAVRYAAVSGGSLLLNTLGEALVNGVLGVPYAIARAIVSALVSVAYNFPLHRAFVFRDTK